MSSLDECESDPILDRPIIRIPIILAYIAVFLICLIGNLFTILVICAHRSMRTATNFFLANLAVADLLVAIFCIFQAKPSPRSNRCSHFVVEYVPFGWHQRRTLAFRCHFVQIVRLRASPCPLHRHWHSRLRLCREIHRRFAFPSVPSPFKVPTFILVLHPLLALKVLTPRFRVLLMASIWAISLMFNLPYYIFTKYIFYKNVAVCTRLMPLANSTKTAEKSLMSTRNIVTSSFVLWYCVPLLIILFLYTRIGLVLWHSAPLKKLTQVGKLRTNSNETTTIVASGNGSAKTRAKRSATHPPPPQSTDGAEERAKRTNSANEFVMAHFRRATMSSDSETDGSEEEDEQERDEEALIGEEGTEEEAEREEAQQVDAKMAPWDDGQSSCQGLAKAMRNNEMLALPTAKDGIATLGTPNGTVLVGTVESRKKVIRLLIAIVSSFAVLTLPHHVRLLYTVWTEQMMCNNSLEPLVQPITYLLLFLSSSCNPFLYAFMSQRFRSAIRDIFKCRRGRARRKSVRTQNSDVVACTTTFGGGGTRSAGGGATTDDGMGIMPMFSSLSRLNSVVGTATAHNQTQMNTAGSERNLLLEQQSNTKSQQQLQQKKLSKKGKKVKKIGQSSFGVASAAHRSNGTVTNIAVVYRKGGHRT
ncbi:hypothetical protein niasHS_002618 [Heterodera schachtii]|uniref:G-protein coupled receptors family 1 profile domain-containing protein n=1 Tax=Heterodera schachtii TaxID=97005 RepID=A0ABD2KKG6_HETSC